MLRLFCLYPWLLIWPWFFGLACASFVEGRAMVWALQALMFGLVRRPVWMLMIFVGYMFGTMCLPLAWRDISFTAYLWRVERLTPRFTQEQNPWSAQVQEWGRGQFASVLPPREAVLAAAMLYGDAAFSSEDRVKVRAVGLSHLVAVSGANILFLLFMFRLAVHRVIRGRRLRFMIDGAGILAIVLLTGASTSVVRGGLMLVLFDGASLFGRRAAFSRILLLSAWFLVLAEPRRLLFDAGYLLSFFACIGLLHAAQKGQDSALLEKLSLRASWFTWIWTAPFQLWFFGSVSWLGLLSNTIVLFVVPWIQALALLVLLIPIRILAFPLEQCLAYLWLVVDRVSTFAEPVTVHARIGFLLMLIGYFVLSAHLIHKRMKSWGGMKSVFADRWSKKGVIALMNTVGALSFLSDRHPYLLREASLSMLELSASKGRRDPHENSA